MLKRVSVVCLFSLLSIFSIYADDLSGVYRYLGKSRKIVASIMTLSMDERGNRIAAEYSAAIQNNREWFLDYVKKHAEEYPLPYNGKFGISEADYEYLIYASSQMKLIKTDDIEIVTKQNGDTLELEFIGKYAFLGKIIFKNEKREITTMYGKYTRGEPINNTDEYSPTGAWVGESWELNKISDYTKPEGIISTFVIGKKMDDTGVIRFTTKSFIPGDEYKYDILIFFSIS